MSHSLCMHRHSLNCNTKHHRSQSSQNKLHNPDNTTTLSVFLLILILNQSYHQKHIAFYTYIIASQSVFSNLYPTALFFLLHDIHILRQMKKFLVDFMNQLPLFITQSINWYDGSTRCVMNLEKTAWFSLRYFCWYYFLNNFSFLVGLLRLFCLLMVGT